MEGNCCSATLLNGLNEEASSAPGSDLDFGLWI